MATIDKRLDDLETLVRPTNGKKKPYCVVYEDGGRMHMTYPEEIDPLSADDLAQLAEEFDTIIRVQYTTAAGLEVIDADDLDGEED